MTFKSLLNLGSAAKSSHPFIDRYHSGSGGSSHHGWQGGNYKSKGGGGGSGAALSALTLLAFLFLINVMQQSLQDTNSTMTTMTTVLLREEDTPVILDARNKNEGKRKEEQHVDTYGQSPVKSTKGHVKLNN